MGCKPKLLPGTQIEDIPENRSVLDFMVQYRDAVQSRSAEEVMNLLAEDYYEDMGTVKQEDDYGAEKLRRELQQNFERTAEIRLRVTVENVIRQDESDLVEVDYRYMQRARLLLPAGERWVTHSDVNRLILRETGEESSLTYAIVSGL